MTQEEILDYNKKCAEFLGVDIHYSVEVYKDSKSPLRQYIDNRPKSEPLLFHSDWNWIEEVLNKIEGENFLYILKSDVYGEERGYSLEFYDNDGEPIFTHLRTYCNKKEAVVQAINQFLIWYNENN